MQLFAGLHLALALQVAAPLPQASAGSPASGSGLSLSLNLPSFRLELFQGDSLIRHYQVAIGDTAYPTPVGAFEITQVDWDPWWVPPASEWAAHDTVTPPGPRNPMGRVRLAFRELYFIHGSPYRATLGSPASHGCVRMSNADATALARLVIQHAAPAVTPKELDRLSSKRGKQTRTILLEWPVPVAIRYEPVVVSEDRLTVYPDVYRRGLTEDRMSEMLAALERSGEAGAALDTARMRAALDRSRGRRFSIPLPALRKVPSLP